MNAPTETPARNGFCPPPTWTGFAWGMAEATAFFLIPDILLGWACLAGARAGTRMLAAILAGSLLGGLAMYGFAAVDAEGALTFVAAVPFTMAWMFETVSAAYSFHGAVGMLYGPSSGIPYKVYAVLAPEHFGALTFAVMTLPARLERLALSWIVFTLAGLFFRRWLAARRERAFSLYALFWIAIYIFYWTSL